MARLSEVRKVSTFPSASLYSTVSVSGFARLRLAIHGVCHSAGAGPWIRCGHGRTAARRRRALDALPSVLRAAEEIKGPDGNPVNALLGTANLILREVEKHSPRAVVLCSGPDAAAYRVELYPAYHADREAAFPDELGPQWEDAGEFFAAFGWTIAASDSLEADDLLGSYARREARPAAGR